jgi:hypothetical protein
MGGRRLRVFVSHSSHTPDERDRLDAIVNDLRAGDDGAEVLCDKAQITDGAHWRDVINALLWDCDAAVILLTPSALDSVWVFKEATILRWRHDRNPECKLLVWASVDRSELENNRQWKTLGLTEIQFVSGDSAEQIAASVKTTLAPIAGRCDRTPLDRLADEIVGRLGSAEESQLQAALNSLNEQIPFDVGDQRRRLGYGIARWILRQPPPALNRLADALAILGRTFPRENALMIIDLVAPLWVDLDTAIWFLRAHWQLPGCRDVAIACREPMTTVRHCIDRAYMPDLSPQCWMLNDITGGAHTDDVVRELRTVVARALKRGPGPRSDDAAIDNFLSKITRRVYIALRLPDDLDVASALQARYPHVTFVFYVPPECLPDGVPPVVDGVGWVAPPLEPETEDEMYADYVNATVTFLG